MFRRQATGSGPEEQLVSGPGIADPTSYSWDGHLILYQTFNSGTNRDIGIVSLRENGKTLGFAQTRYSETQGQFSPDGKWVAHVSDESGFADVYVQALAAGGERTRVSTGGGVQPRWRSDGRELYYLAPGGDMMAAPIQTTPTLAVGSPILLFATGASSSAGLGTTANYDVTPDGQRFVVVSNLSDGGRQPITVVVNWASMLQ
jgi:Tol biopolymer transport system component